MKKRSDLRAYQIEGVEVMKQAKRKILFLDMGLGKTVMTLTALSDILQPRQRILIVAPKRVAETVWKEEINNWEHLQHLKCVEITGTKDRRERIVKNENYNVFTISRDLLPNFIKETEIDLSDYFDILVIDELSSFKSAKSLRFKTLRPFISRFERIYGLTGTPTSNGFMDLYSQIFIFDQGQRLGRTLTSFRNKYFYPEKTNGAIVYKYGITENSKLAIQKQIEDLTFTIRNMLDLPVVYNTIKVSLPFENQIAYKKLLKDKVLYFKNDAIAADNPAVLFGVAKQYAEGCVYSENSKHYHVVHEKKFEVLSEILESLQEQNIIVWYSHRSQMEEVLRRFASFDPILLQSEKDVLNWNLGNIKLLLAHPKSAGHGINLQHGGHHMVWIGFPTSLEEYQQANARLVRPGQKETVLIHQIVVDNTIEELVLESLERKESVQENFLNYLSNLEI